MVDNKKIDISVKIYPLFYGLTSDLIFWIAINTLFLTTVKHLSVAQINSIEAFGTGIGIIFQIFIIKIVRKIGNLKAVRIGTILLFLSATINTVATSYFGLLIAEVCYTIGFVFKAMDNVILIKNLKYLNRSEEYIKYQTKGSTIYSLVTLIISLLSGFLFNVNPYLPMVICMILCFINILLTYYLYEVPNLNNEVKNNDKSITFNKSILLMILLYGAFYAMVAVGQKNSKLFIQLNMQDFLSLDKVSVYMGVIIFLSRISRLVSNLMFLKVYKKLKNKIIFLFEIMLCFTFTLLLIGNFTGRKITGIMVMALGYFLYLGIRDPFSAYMRKILFDNSKEKVHDKIINYISLSRKLFTLMYGLIISMMLMNLSYIYVMSVLLLLTISLLITIIKIYRTLELSKESA